jgi:hypothetical protein
MNWTTPKPEPEIDDDVSAVKTYRPSAKAIDDYNAGYVDPANPYVWSSEPLKPGKFERPATGWQTEAGPWRPIVGARVIVDPFTGFPGTIIQVGSEQSEIRFDSGVWGNPVYMPNSWLVPVTKK